MEEKEAIWNELLDSNGWVGGWVGGRTYPAEDEGGIVAVRADRKLVFQATLPHQVVEEGRETGEFGVAGGIFT